MHTWARICLKQETPYKSCEGEGERGEARGDDDEGEEELGEDELGEEGEEREGDLGNTKNVKSSLELWEPSGIARKGRYSHWCCFCSIGSMAGYTVSIFSLNY